MSQQTGHLSPMQVARAAMSSGFKRYDVEGAQDALREAFGADRVLTLNVVVRRYLMRGKLDWPAGFHALRAGEAMVQALETGTVVRLVDGTYERRGGTAR